MHIRKYNDNDNGPPPRYPAHPPPPYTPGPLTNMNSATFMDLQTLQNTLNEAYERLRAVEQLDKAARRHEEERRLRTMGPPRKKKTHIISMSEEAMRKWVPGRSKYHDARALVPLYHFRVPNIKCMHWKPPPQDVCQRKSGIMTEVQAWVLKDPRALPTIQAAINAITEAFNKGHDNVFIKIVCIHGTHRSVATAEMLAQTLKNLGHNTMVVHPHRRKMPEDRY